MAWFYLILAGLFEIGWATGLKYTDGFTKPQESIITLIMMILSVFFLALAVQKIPLSTGYVIWTGIGAVGTVIFGIVYYGESAALLRLFFMATIVASIAGLKYTSGH